MLWVLTALNLVLASLSLVAAITARSHLTELRRRLASRSTRSLAVLDSEVTSLSTAFSSLSATVKRLSSKTGMQELRARRSAELELPTTPAERKIALKKALAEGKIHVLRDKP